MIHLPRIGTFVPLAVFLVITRCALAQSDAAAARRPAAAPKADGGYSIDAQAFANKVNHAVKLRPEQRPAMLETLRAFDVDLKAYEKAHDTKNEQYGFLALAAAKRANDTKKVFEIESRGAKADVAFIE